MADSVERKQIRFNNILFAFEFSPVSEAALPYAVAMARRFGSMLYILHVISEESYTHVSASEQQARLAQSRYEAERRIQELLARLSLAEVPHQILLHEGQVWPVLSVVMEEHGIDLIVSGTHGRRGVEKLLSGSVAEEISELATRPVLLIGPEVREQPETEPRVERILFVTDFSPESRYAMDYAYGLARTYAAKLYFLHVIENVWEQPLSTKMSADAFFHMRLLENGWPQNDAGIEPEFLIEFGSPEDQTLETAEKRKIQLLILSVPATGHPALAARLPGPLAYNIASHARCPVLAVRGMVEQLASAAPAAVA